MTDNPVWTAVAPLAGNQQSRLAAVAFERAAAAKEITISADASCDPLAVLDGFVGIVERHCGVVIGPPRSGSCLAADQS